MHSVMSLTAACAARSEETTVMYLIQRRRVWFLHHTVPPSIRPIVGKARLTATLGTTDRKVAERRAKVIEARWIAELDQAREPGAMEADAAWWRRALKEAPDDHQRALVEDLIATEGRRRVDRAASRLGFLDEREDGYQEALVGELAAATRFAKTASGQIVPFTEHLAAWVATLTGEEKTSQMKSSTVKEFSKTCPTLADVTRRVVQGWADQLVIDGKKPKTVSRKRSELSGYWSWLQRQGLVPEDAQPFDKIVIQRPGRKAGSNGNGRRQAFTAVDTSKFLEAALAAHDQVLADLIELGRYTGCRVEEIASTKVTDIDLTAKTWTITNSKTAAGLRTLPIHSKLLATVDRLVQTSSDGYLLSG
jgi:integrase